MNRFAYIVSMITIILAGVLIGWIIALLIAPATVWFEYKDIVPTKTEYGIGEKLQFRSYSAHSKEAHLHWNDVLRCDTGQGFGYYSFANSEATILPRPVKVNPAPWTYDSSFPVPPAECYLESSIRADLPFGIKKTQVFTGKVFKIIE